MKRLLAALALLMTSVVAPALGQQPTTLSDKEIKVTHYESLKFPPLARQTRVSGIVVVSVTLDDEGKVSDAVALSGNKVLIPDCLQNVKKWRFHANTSHAAIIVYNFRFSGRPCGSVLSSFKFRAPNLATISGCATLVEPYRSNEQC